MSQSSAKVLTGVEEQLWLVVDLVVLEQVGETRADFLIVPRRLEESSKVKQGWLDLRQVEHRRDLLGRIGDDVDRVLASRLDLGEE